MVSDPARTTGIVDARLNWEDHGVSVHRGVLEQATLEELRAWVDELAEGSSGGMHHHELTVDGTAIARSELFADDHPRLGAFVRGTAAEIVGEIVGEPVVLFKEKVNYKHPGGAGFAPHQDATAYRFGRIHFSLMVPLDPATESSGCLWFAADSPGGLLPTDDRGRLRADSVDALRWIPVEVQPGDVVVFDSHAPHLSHTNSSGRSRRALYLTYTLRAEGDFRDAYYGDKSAEFAAGDGTFDAERVRISINDDFLGRPVPTSGAGDDLPGRGPLDLLASDAASRLYDEAVSELDHALQCAALAESGGAPDHMVVAALLHDVGHLVLGDLTSIDAELDADARHAAAGARYLSRWFGPEVTVPIALHVRAKRYLVTTDPSYGESLSQSSLRSLELQGGCLQDHEVAAFESNDMHAEALALRRWDDLAKDPEGSPPDLAHFAPLVRAAVRAG